MITYKVAILADLEDVVQLRLLMQQEVNMGEAYNLSEYLESLKKYYSQVLVDQTHQTVLAYSQDRCVGCAGVSFYQKPPSIVGGSGINGYVSNVYTRKEFRRQGVGQGLMRYISQLGRVVNADKLHLGSSKDGVMLYRGLGYSEPRHVYMELKSKDF